MNPQTEISPSTQLLLHEIHKLFDKYEAKWDQRFAEMDAAWNRRVVSRGSSVPTPAAAMAAIVVADNWAGLFDGGDAADGAEAAAIEATVAADNWAGLFDGGDAAEGADLLAPSAASFVTLATAPSAATHATDFVVHAEQETRAAIAHSAHLLEDTPTLLSVRAPTTERIHLVPDVVTPTASKPDHFFHDITTTKLLPTKCSTVCLNNSVTNSSANISVAPTVSLHPPDSTRVFKPRLDMLLRLGLIGDLDQTPDSKSMLTHYEEHAGDALLFVGGLCYAEPMWLEPPDLTPPSLAPMPPRLQAGEARCSRSGLLSVSPGLQAAELAAPGMTSSPLLDALLVFDKMPRRYTMTDFPPPSNGLALFGPISVVHETPEVFEEMPSPNPVALELLSAVANRPWPTPRKGCTILLADSIELCFDSWPNLCWGWFVAQYTPPQLASSQLDLSSDGIHLRPTPWPSFGCVAAVLYLGLFSSMKSCSVHTCWVKLFSCALSGAYWCTCFSSLMQQKHWIWCSVCNIQVFGAIGICIAKAVLLVKSKYFEVIYIDKQKTWLEYNFNSVVVFGLHLISTSLFRINSTGSALNIPVWCYCLLSNPPWLSSHQVICAAIMLIEMELLLLRMAISLDFQNGLSSWFALSPDSYDHAAVRMLNILDVTMHLNVPWSPSVWACSSAVMWFKLSSLLLLNYSVGFWAGILDMFQLCPWLCDCQRKQSFFISMVAPALSLSFWPHIDSETEFHTTLLNQLRTAVPIWPPLIALMIRRSVLLGALLDAKSVTLAICWELMILDIGFLPTNTSTEVQYSANCLSWTNSYHELFGISMWINMVAKGTTASERLTFQYSFPLNDPIARVHIMPLKGVGPATNLINLLVILILAGSRMCILHFRIHPCHWLLSEQDIPEAGYDGWSSAIILEPNRDMVCSIRNNVSRLLVFEYMTNDSLGDMLHSAKHTILDWPMRYEIVVNVAADRLSYLHNDCKPPIIFWVVKSNNILLDGGLLVSVKDLQVPWDPGGTEILHRLGGKPKLKKGGMLGIIHDWTVKWAMGLGPWPSRASVRRPSTRAQALQLGRSSIKQQNRPKVVNMHLVLGYVDDPRDREAASLVCRRWHRIDALSRKHVTVGFCYAVEPARLLARFPRLESLALKGRPRAAMYGLIPDDFGAYAEPWVAQLAAPLDCLKALHLRRMTVTDEDIAVLVRARGHMLQVLKLDKCSGFSTDALRLIARSCRSLRTLFLEECIIDDKGCEWLHELAVNNSVLVTLNFYMTDIKVEPSDLELLARNCKSLISLKMSDCDLSDLIGFLQTSKALQEFAGGAFFEVGAYTKYEKVKFPPRLCFLGGLTFMSKHEMPAIFPYSATLKKLDLQYTFLTAEDHCQLIAKCPNLLVLEVRNVIGDIGLQVVADTCKKLRRLRIERGDDDPGQEEQGGVSQVGLTAVAVGCRELEYIAAYVSDITNGALESIGTFCKNLYDFRLVLLDKQNKITDLPLDNGVRALLKNCTKLRRFAFYLRPGGLSDVGLGYIGEYSGNIQYMLLGNVGESDNGLIQFAMGCTNLRKLELRSCCFSEQALAVAVLQMPSLRYIWVQGHRASQTGQDLMLMARPYWNIEFAPPCPESTHGMMEDGQPCVDKHAQVLAYYSLAGRRPDCPEWLVTLHPA